jgi:hypothetical protein
VFVDPVTLAWNCCVPPEETVTLVGEIATETVGGGEPEPPEPLLPLSLEVPPPQPLIVRRTQATANKDEAQKTGRDIRRLEAGVAYVRVDEQQLGCVASNLGAKAEIQENYDVVISKGRTRTPE